MKYFDQHCHLDDSKFDDNREEIIKAIYDFGVTNLVSAGYSLEGSIRAIELANKYDDIYLTKEDRVSFTLETPIYGDFNILQDLINKAINASTSGQPAVLNLNRTYEFTPGVDHGQINITGPIIITGNGNVTISGQTLTRIFNITYVTWW